MSQKLNAAIAVIGDEHNESAYPLTAALKRTSLEVAFGPRADIVNAGSVQARRDFGNSGFGTFLVVN